MKCQDVQEGLGTYWDLPAFDERRQAVDAHIRQCAACREEFEIWEESMQLIRTTVVDAPEDRSPLPVSKRVMERIYTDEAWRMPVPQRLHVFSYKWKRNVSAVIALCMTLFIFGFVFSVSGIGSDDLTTRYGLKPVATVSADLQSSPIKSKLLPVATASLKDPHMVSVGPYRTVPDYMIIVSLLGMCGTILIMNWLTRTKT